MDHASGPLPSRPWGTAFPKGRHRHLLLEARPPRAHRPKAKRRVAMRKATFLSEQVQNVAAPLVSLARKVFWNVSGQRRRSGIDGIGSRHRCSSGPYGLPGQIFAAFASAKALVLPHTSVIRGHSDASGHVAQQEPLQGLRSRQGQHRVRDPSTKSKETRSKPPSRTCSQLTATFACNQCQCRRCAPPAVIGQPRVWQGQQVRSLTFSLRVFVDVPAQ